MNIFLLDNYDSFTFNLVHLLEQFDDIEVSVFRNDEVEVEAALDFDRIVLSPGPGIPEEAGILIPMIKRFQNEKPILGVCLGMQAIVETFGGTLLNMPICMHGVSEKTNVLSPVDPLFRNIDPVFMSGRYHSWAVNPATLPSFFRITATDDLGTIMALTHENQHIRGVQFHPESILTDLGKQLISNWLTLC